MTNVSKVSGWDAAAIILTLCLLPAIGSAWVIVVGAAAILTLRLWARRADRRAIAMTAAIAAVIAAIIAVAIQFLAYW